LDGVGAIVVRTIAQAFRGNWPGYLHAIRESARRADSAELRRCAHALRGVLGNFGTTPAVTLTQQIEVLGSQGSAEQAAPLLPPLEAALQTLD
ncbi:Hpt domain-containing protein, partial [Leptospira sp. SA-E8]|uniref:Hpt domain-containing protein n=1 Tax=Leptospira sp. SA-E8 TaxID=3422259 RepID=UPI003EC0649B